MKMMFSENNLCLWRRITFCGTVFACDDCKWGEGRVGFALSPV